jgi:hypothetical protein
MPLAVFSFKFRIPCLPQALNLKWYRAGRRNPKSTFETANFFMGDAPLRFLKYDISRPDPKFFPRGEGKGEG